MCGMEVLLESVELLVLLPVEQVGWTWIQIVLPLRLSTRTPCLLHRPQGRQKVFLLSDLQCTRHPDQSVVSVPDTTHVLDVGAVRVPGRGRHRRSCMPLRCLSFPPPCERLR